MKTQNSRNPIDRSPLRSGLLFIALAFGCFALSPAPNTFGVVPAPDGGYPGFNTAEGQNALLHLTTGTGNTALGWFSLENVTTGGFNTGVGAGTLVLNSGDRNTATGAAALLLNTTGSGNTANGAVALLNNTTGNSNTANGDRALHSNTTGEVNTAIGSLALFSNTTGNFNTAIGDSALENSTTGDFNMALGSSAGLNVTTASNTICIGALGENESNTCYIKNIFGVTSTGAAAVYVNSVGKLGTVVSSRRFKDEIKPMDKASEAILALKPVTFRYKHEIDPARSPQFGLVAEEVEKVNPDLVVRNTEGKVNTVRYEAVNAMLLNEFLKEHRKVEKLEATVAQQRKDFEATTAQQQREIKALTANLKEQASQIQKVSARLDLQKAAPQTVLNNQ